MCLRLKCRTWFSLHPTGHNQAAIGIPCRSGRLLAVTFPAALYDLALHDFGGPQNSFPHSTSSWYSTYGALLAFDAPLVDSRMLSPRIGQPLGQIPPLPEPPPVPDSPAVGITFPACFGISALARSPIKQTLTSDRAPEGPPRLTPE